MEIERKFVLSSLPPAGILSEGMAIAQGYVVTSPGELRLRRKVDQCFLTVKGDGTLSREEWEQDVPPWVFNTLWPATEGRRVEKTRYEVEYEGLTLEVDKYHGHLAGLVTFECEFPDEASAHRFQLPVWAVEAVDVTTDKRYKNKALAVAKSRPE